MPNKTSTDIIIDVKPIPSYSNSINIGYYQPLWSSIPLTDSPLFNLQVWKEGTITNTISLFRKPFYIIGRNTLNSDITLANPTVSRIHCVLQYNIKGELFLYDVNTAHGTFLNGSKIESQKYIKLKDLDTFKVGQSSKLFIINGLQQEISEDKEEKKEKKKESKKEDLSSMFMKNDVKFNNESNWGIEDYDEEIIQYQREEDQEDENNNNIDDIKEIKERGDLTSKQKEYISKIEDLIDERENILSLKEKIKYELEDEENEKDRNKYKKIQSKNYYYTKRIIEIKENIVSLRNKLNDSIKSSEQNKLKFDRKKLKEYNDDDNDEYYDRARNIEDEDNNEIGKENEDNAEKVYEELKVKLEVLIQERQHLQDKINNYKLTKANNQNKIDPLDLYFIEMSEGNESNNSGIKGLEEKLQKINDDISKKEEILNYISPFNISIKPTTNDKNKFSEFKAPIPISRSTVVSNKKTNKESIIGVMEQFKNFQNNLMNEKMQKEKEKEETIENEIKNSIEKGKESIKIDEDMQIKLEQYENSFNTNNNKNDTQKQKHNSEKSLFKEIVANVGNTNFDLQKYPKINKLTEEKKKKKERAKIELPNEEEYLGSLIGEKRNRDDTSNIQFTATPQFGEKDEQIDIFDLQNKSKWKESNVSSNPFSKYINNTEE